MDGIGCGGVVDVGYHNVDVAAAADIDDFDDNLLDQHHWSNQMSDHHRQSLEFVVD